MAHYQPGTYEVSIEGQGFGESDQKKTPFFFLKFIPIRIVFGSETDDVDTEYEREVKLYLTDNTIARVVATLRSIGWTGDSFSDLEPGGYEFRGNVVNLLCSHTQRDDNVYENWDFPRVSSSGSESVSGVSRKLDNLYAKALKKGAMKHAPVAEAVSSLDVGPDDGLAF